MADTTFTAAVAVQGEDVLDSEVGPNWAQKLRDAVFAVLHDMCRDTDVSFLLICGGWLFALLSLLMLPLGPSPALPWRGSAVMQGLWSIAAPIWWSPPVGQYIPGSPHDWSGMYAGFAGWMAVNMVVVAWLTAGQLQWTEYRPKWMTVILRLSSRMAINVLWTPLMINLLSPFSCTEGRTWMGTSLACWSGSHVAMAVGSALLLPLVIAWFGLTALTYIDRVPDYSGKKNLLAAPHGRIDAAMLLLKAGLAAFLVFASSSMNSWGFLLVCLSAGLTWMWLYITYLPYHHPTLNGVQVGASTVFVSACVCGLLATGIGPGSGGHQSGAIAFLLFLPVTIYSGWAFMAARTRMLVTGKSASGHELEMGSPYIIDVRVRCMLVDCIASGTDPRINHETHVEEDGSTEASNLFAADGTFTAVPVEGAGPGGGPQSDLSGSGRFRQGVGSSSRRGRDHSAYSKEDDEWHRVMRIREDCAELWSHGSRSFGNSAMLHLFWAGYQAAITRNSHLERLRLRDAVDKADWSQIDIHFFAWSRLQTIAQEEDSDGAAKMNVERRMRFEKMQAASRSSVAIARGNILAFWSELAAKRPDLQKLKVYGLAINNSLFAADQNFKELLELAPQNATVMRNYADFLLELSNNPRKAQQLLEDAEQMEDDASRAHAVAQASNVQFYQVVSNFDLSADSVALMKVSSESGRLGTITHVNGQACKLFGFSQLELMAKSLSDLIPQPIGTVHNSMMSSFLLTGAMRFIGVPRVSFILHRAGYMAPVKINVRASSEGFAAVIDSMVTPPGEMYVWCLGTQAGWRITSVCESAMGALGVDLPSLKAGSISLSRFLPTAASIVEKAVQGSMPLVELNNTAYDNSEPTSGRGASTKSVPSLGTSKGLMCQLQAQAFNFPQLGQPLYMLRLKKTGSDTAAQLLAKQRMTGTISEDSEEESGSEVDSDAVHGSEDSESSLDSGRGKRKLAAAKGKGGVPTPAGSKNGSKGSGRGSPVYEHGRAPHAMPRAGSNMMDISACPVMTATAGKGSPSTAGTSEPTGSFATFPSGSRAHTSKPPSHSERHPQQPSHTVKKGSSDEDNSDTSRPSTVKDPLPSVGEDYQVDTSRVSTDGEQPPEVGKGRSARTGAAHHLPGQAPPTHAGAADKGAQGLIVDSSKPVSIMKRASFTLLDQAHPDSMASPRRGSSAAPLHSALKKSTSFANKQNVYAPPPARGYDTESSHPTATHERVSTMGSQKQGGNAKEGGSHEHADDDKGSAFSGSKKHKAGSTHSKGSGGSGTSATSVTEILRRGVNAKAGKLETSLMLTRWAVLLVFALTAALNIGSLLATRTLMNQLSENIMLVFKNGRRAVLAQRLYSNVQSWALSQAGLDTLPNMTIEVDRNAKYLTQLEDLNLYLYSKVDGSLRDEKLLYTDGSALQVHDLSPGQNNSLELINFRYTNRTLNLANAVIEFVSRMRRVLTLNNTQIQYSNADVFWVVDTGSNALRTGMNNSLMYANQRSQFQGDRIDATDQIILIVSEVAFVVVFFCVMLPAVTQVVHSHHEVFHTFIQVPLPIVRALRATVQKRINAILKANEEAEVGIDIGGLGNELGGADAETDGGMSAVLSKERDKMKKRMKDEAGGGDDDDASEAGSAALNTAVNSNANKLLGLTGVDGIPQPTKKEEKKGLLGRKRKQRTYRRAGTDLISILAKFIWPVLLWMGYFAIMWWFKGGIVKTITQMRAEMLYMTQAEIYMNLATIRSRFAAAACEPTYLSEMLTLAQSNGAYAENLIDAVLYGDPERNMRGLLQASSNDFASLWTKNGCLENDGWFYSMEECRTFDAGITARGLLGAFRSFADYSRQLVTRRKKSIHDPDCVPDRKNDAGTVAYLVNRFGSALLAVGFQQASQLTQEAAIDYLLQFDQVYSTVVAITCAALAVYWVLVYAPLISRLDTDIKDVRLLLLLFPDEVARSVPAIVAAGRQLLAEAGSSAGSVASGAIARR